MIFALLAAGFGGTRSFGFKEWLRFRWCYDPPSSQQSLISWRVSCFSGVKLTAGRPTSDNWSDSRYSSDPASLSSRTGPEAIDFVPSPEGFWAVTTAEWRRISMEWASLDWFEGSAVGVLLGRCHSDSRACQWLFRHRTSVQRMNQYHLGALESCASFGCLRPWKAAAAWSTFESPACPSPPDSKWSYAPPSTWAYCYLSAMSLLDRNWYHLGGDLLICRRSGGPYACLIGCGQLGWFFVRIRPWKCYPAITSASWRCVTSHSMRLSYLLWEPEGLLHRSRRICWLG